MLPLEGRAVLFQSRDRGGNPIAERAQLQLGGAGAFLRLGDLGQSPHVLLLQLPEALLVEMDPGLVASGL